MARVYDLDQPQGGAPASKISLCELSLPDTNFEEDIELAKKVGASGLGLDENKLDVERLETQRETLAASGVEATISSPKILTVLPQPDLRPGLYAGPSDPDERLAEMVECVQRLATFEPDTIFFCSGPAGDYGDDKARSILVESLETLGPVARTAGSRLALEPMRADVRDTWTIVSSLREALSLIDEVGRDDLGIVFDTWHMWDSPDVYEMIPEVVDRIYGVQIADYRQPTRGPRDRLIAGDGVADIPGLLRMLRESGYDGWYDMEVFSDDGRFGHAYEDSLWALGPTRFAERQVEGFRECWAKSGG